MSHHLISVAEASRLVAQYAPLGGWEWVELRHALGRVTAEAVATDIDSPPHDKTIVDGFAVRAEDLAQGVGELEVIETVMAGMWPNHILCAGQATRIMTGAPLPIGADAVVMVERTTAVAGEGQGRVRIDDSALRVGQNVVRRGAAMRVGDEVIAARRCLRSVEIGLLAEVGRETVKFCRRPTVAVLSTGSELVPHQDVPRAGQIRNSNGPMLAAAIHRAGGVARDLPIGPDDPAKLSALIREGLDADMLLISGGVSAGDLDLTPGILRELGVVEVFHKVQLKPGKPLWFGVLRGEQDKLVFGLPGNPVSSLVCFLLFVAPAIRRFQGEIDVEPRTQRAVLSAPYRQRGPRAAYVPSRYEWTTDGPQVTPLSSQGSGDLRALADANALAHFPPGDQDYEAGALIEILPLDSA
jgi:molybdopterin molybdotransferase